MLTDCSCEEILQPSKRTSGPVCLRIGSSSWSFPKLLFYFHLLTCISTSGRVIIVSGMRFVIPFAVFIFRFNLDGGMLNVEVLQSVFYVLLDPFPLLYRLVVVDHDVQRHHIV